MHNKKSRLLDRRRRWVLSVHSLRWHYPDQING